MKFKLSALLLLLPLASCATQNSPVSQAIAARLAAQAVTPSEVRMAAPAASPAFQSFFNGGER